jgi:hypothetical protein
MTLVAAVIFGLVSGFAVRGARRAILAALVPWLAVLGLQTWLLASGQANNAESTVADAGYWIIQVIALGLCLGIAAFVASRRVRRAERRHEAAAVVGR